MTENDDDEKYEFEWDPKKAKRNLKKHGVSFEEASTIFDDPDFISFLDDEHSDDEERYNWTIKQSASPDGGAHRAQKTHSNDQRKKGNEK